MALLRRLTTGREASQAVNSVDLTSKRGICRIDPKEPSNHLDHSMI